jgi:hypothetical protein
MPGKKSMLKREEYVVGGLTKAFVPVAKRVAKIFEEDVTEKEIKTKLNTIIDKIEAAPLGSTKKETFQKIADEEDVALSLVKDANKINSYRSGGGKSDSLLGEVAATVRAMTKKPTSGQADSEALGGTKTTREARRGKGFAILGTAALTVPTTALSTAWFMSNDKEPTPKEASDFEKAFSKAHNAGKETFMFKGKKYTTDVRKGKSEGGVMKQLKQKIMSLLAQKEKAANEEEKEKIQMQLDSFSEEDMREALKEKDTPEEGLFDNNNRISQEPKKIRLQRADGGSMLVPPEMPVDTYTPEEQAMAEETQVSDVEMEDDYMGYVLGESLDDNEQEYLMGALESDPRLSEIFDKVVMTASEFSGAGKVEGPGDGVSDSIPARLSDGEFVITQKATEQIGAENLQTMMDNAERMADGGIATRKATGGLLDSSNMLEPNTGVDEQIKKSMLYSNQVPSLRGTRVI